MKNLLMMIKAWLVKVGLSLKVWSVANWFMIVNYVIILASYNIVYDHDDVRYAELLLGLWIFASVAYGGYKWFIKKNK